MSSLPSTAFPQVYTVVAKKRGATHLIFTPDGKALHSDHEATYPLALSLLKLGWTRIVCELYEQRGDHLLRIGTMVVTPNKKAKSTSHDLPERT